MTAALHPHRPLHELIEWVTLAERAAAAVRRRMDDLTDRDIPAAEAEDHRLNGKYAPGFRLQSAEQLAAHRTLFGLREAFARAVIELRTADAQVAEAERALGRRLAAITSAAITSGGAER